MMDGKIKVSVRIRDTHPGSEFFHPGSRKHIEKFKYFNHNKLLPSSRKYNPGCLSRIRILIFTHPVSRIKGSKRNPRKYDPGCSSRIWILIFYPSRMQEVKKAPDPGSASLIKVGYRTSSSVGLGGGVFSSFCGVLCWTTRIPPTWCQHNINLKKLINSGTKTQEKQCSGSMAFRYGSGSGALYLWLTDPDPALSVIDLQDANEKNIFYVLLPYIIYVMQSGRFS